MERWQRQAERTGNAAPDDLPVALWTEGGHGPVIHATNRAARLAGVRTGARLADMRAVCPALRADPADPAADRAALERLALWVRRWCPWSATDGDDGLILDTTGSDHLWGGEAAMLADMEARLALLGFSSRLAVAPGRGAAWALARFGPVRAICHDPRDLDPLPVAALRLEPDTELLLHRLGLKTIAQLAAVPRLSLARRFVRAAPPCNPLIRLDQATGRLAEPLAPPDAPPRFRADARLAEPVLDPAPCLPALCADLCAQLARAGRGARRLTLSVWRTDGEMRWIAATTAAPSRDAAHLAFLFRDRLERIDPGFGFDLIVIEAQETEALDARQSDLAGEPDHRLDLSQLVDRLASRFGPDAVRGLHHRASHIPERAEVRTAPLAPQEPEPRSLADRPVRLLERPEEVQVLYAVPEGPPAQFVWRRHTHRVTRYQGPERIAPEWWHDRPGTRLRDYFRIEDETGRRFWLYREGLHEDGRGGMPRWFLHGMFA